jgi:small subunit ribosomal protein S8
MVTDPIADLLIRLQNAGKRGHEAVLIPASRLKSEVLRVLKSEGFIVDFEPAADEGHPMLSVRLRYVADGEPVITTMRRVSKPGRRVYVKRREVKQVRAGLGVAIVSTSKGVMTDQECRRAGLGGEVLCQVW